jgi:hypothetical protein
MHPIRIEGSGIKMTGKTQLLESMKPKLILMTLSEPSCAGKVNNTGRYQWT